MVDAGRDLGVTRKSCRCIAKSTVLPEVPLFRYCYSKACKSIVAAQLTLLGGFLLYGDHVLPQLDNCIVCSLQFILEVIDIAR